MAKPTNTRNAPARQSETFLARTAAAMVRESRKPSVGISDPEALVRVVVKAVRPSIDKIDLIRRIAKEMDIDPPGVLDMAICQYIDALLGGSR